MSLYRALRGARERIESECLRERSVALSPVRIGQQCIELGCQARVLRSKRLLIVRLQQCDGVVEPTLVDVQFRRVSSDLVGVKELTQLLTGIGDRLDLGANVCSLPLSNSAASFCWPPGRYRGADQFSSITFCAWPRLRSVCPTARYSCAATNNACSWAPLSDTRGSCSSNRFSSE